MRRTLKILGWIAGVLFLLLVVLHVFLMTGLTGLIRSRAAPRIKEAMGVDLRLDRLALNPAAGTLDLAGLSLGNPAGFVEPDSFSLQNAHVDLGVLSLLGGVTRVSDLRVDDLRLVVVRNADGTVNWRQLQETLGTDRQPKPEAEPETGPEAEPEEPGPEEAPPSDEPVPEGPEGPAPEPTPTRPPPDVKVPALRIDNATVRTRFEFIDHAAEQPRPVDMVVTVAARNIRTVPSGPDAWGTLTVRSYRADDPDTLITDLSGRIAPILNPFTASFDLTGRVASLDMRQMTNLTRKADIEADSVSADVALTCRDGFYDRNESLITLHLTNPRLTGKLAKKADNAKLPDPLDLPLTIYGPAHRPQVDQLLLAARLFQIATKTYAGNKLQKSVDKALDNLFKSIQKPDKKKASGAPAAEPGQ